MRWARFHWRRSSMILRFGRSIERRQRFIEKQYGGIGHKRSRQGSALAFSAGDLLRVSLREMRNSKCSEESPMTVSYALPAADVPGHSGRFAPPSDAERGRDSETHIRRADSRRERSSGLLSRIENTRPATAIRPESGRVKSGNAIQQSRLACAGWAEQNRESGAAWNSTSRIEVRGRESRIGSESVPDRASRPDWSHHAPQRSSREARSGWQSPCLSVGRNARRSWHSGKGVRRLRKWSLS